MRLHIKIAIALAAAATFLFPATTALADVNNPTTVDQYIGGNGVNAVDVHNTTIGVNAEPYPVYVPFVHLAALR